MAKFHDQQRYNALHHCLTMLESHLRVMSASEMMLVPKPGYEAAWEDVQESCETIRQMMREARYGSE